MKNDILKELALKAKNRLIHKDMKGEGDKKDYRIKIIKSGDDAFYNKVKNLLGREEEILNPIKFLMDDGLLSEMSDGEREKYLFETVDKYNKFKAQIEDQNQVGYSY